MGIKHLAGQEQNKSIKFTKFNCEEFRKGFKIYVHIFIGLKGFDLVLSGTVLVVGGFRESSVRSC